MKRLLLVFAIALQTVFTSAAMAAGPEDGPARRITVFGEGEMAISPDIALVTLTVMREAESAREALDANSEAMASVTSAMTSAGIESRDMQTSGFNISPRYIHPQRADEPQEPRIQAYQVTNTLSVRVRNLERLGEILDEAVTLGVNQGGSISFSNDDPSSALTEARRRAVADAVEKARTLSDAAGVSLGEVVSISEQSFSPPPVPMGAKAMRTEAFNAVPVESGENTYLVQVEMTFALED